MQTNPYAQGTPLHLQVIPSKPAKSILEELARYPLRDDVRNRADVIYNAMHCSTHRITKRRMQLFYCVYNAYKELGITVEPFKLGRMFGLTAGEVQKTNSMFSYLQTGYQAKNKFYSPLELLPDICRDIGIAESTIADVLAVSQDTLNRNPQLYQSSPQTVAAGLASYYITTRGIRLANKDDIVQATSRSLVTINSTRDRIATVDNAN